MRLIRFLCLGAICVLFFTACSSTASDGTNEPVTVQTTRETANASTVVDAQPTSRGDKLEASVPATLKIGTSRPTLIEFFRYT